MRSPLIFRIYKNEQIYLVKQFLDEERIVLGSSSHVQIHLDSSDVSGIHCLVEKRGNQFYLCDMGSEFGTRKDNKIVLDEVIENEESFNIGPFRIIFMIAGQSHKTTSTPQLKNSSEIVDRPVLSNVKENINEVELNSKNSSELGIQQKMQIFRQNLRVGSGKNVEVLVVWQDRILQTYHFGRQDNVSLGSSSADVEIPLHVLSSKWSLLEISTNTFINTSKEMKLFVSREGEVQQVTESKYKLNQDEACIVELKNGFQIVIRYVAKSKIMPLGSPFIFGSSELIGILASLIIAVLTSLIVSVSKPKAAPDDEEQLRLTQITFVKNENYTPPINVKSELPETVENSTKQPTPAITQKVELGDKTQQSQTAGNSFKQNVKAKQESGTATEVKAKNPNLKKKLFTSVKQGGAVKNSNQSGANANSKQEDPTKSGLLAAFGEGGARSKLDQAYTGAGELIGAGEKAKGNSGFNTNREGEDLGLKTKDTGAGGAGSATEGISGVDTKGRGGGLGDYGSGTGFGSKDRTQIRFGGGEESFVGSIDRDAVYRVLKAAYSQFKACYQREYKVNSSLAGKVVVSWEIHAQGVAKNVRVAKDKSTLNNFSVEECVKARMQALRFPEPPPNSTAEVTIPFVFQPQ